MKKSMSVLVALVLWGAAVANGNGAVGPAEGKMASPMEAPSSRTTLGFSALFAIAVGLLLLRRQSARG